MTAILRQKIILHMTFKLELLLSNAQNDRVRLGTNIVMTSQGQLLVDGIIFYQEKP